MAISGALNLPSPLFDPLSPLSPTSCFSMLSTPIQGLRAFRLLRALRLLKAVPTLRQLLHTVSMMLAQVGHFGALMLVVLYVFALIGMQLLAGRMRFDAVSGLAVPPPWANVTVAERASGGSTADVQGFGANANASGGAYHGVVGTAVTAPRSNCDDLLAAWMTVFQVLTSEDWQMLMFDARRAVGNKVRTLYADVGAGGFGTSLT